MQSMCAHMDAHTCIPNARHGRPEWRRDVRTRPAVASFWICVRCDVWIVVEEGDVEWDCGCSHDVF